jgi:hypothetical protein
MRLWLHSNIHYAALPDTTVPGTQAEYIIPFLDSALNMLDLYNDTFNSSDYKISNDISPCWNPLLGNDRETNNETMPDAKQQILSKY